MSAITPVNIDIRSYGRDSAVDRHDFAQLVLPLGGTLEMDIAGRGAVLDRSRAAFVAPGTDHVQYGDAPNRSLIVDLDAASLDCAQGELLVGASYLSLTPPALPLIDYMGLMLAGGALPEMALQLWMPLLVDALTDSNAGPPSRLAAMMAAVQADPARPWTTAMMAACAGLSVSRLHALFRAEFDTTPRAWLADRRLDLVQRSLAEGRRSIAEIACDAGYSDQSALTRAMRRATGMTPAAWRRQHQESGPRNR